MTEIPADPNQWARTAWETNAEFWDARMAEGNEFFKLLVWPAVARLLDLKPGQRVMDVACGNGLTSRRMAELGALVTGVDFSAGLLRLAQERSQPWADQIEYKLVDATDETALVEAGGGRSYDAVLCNMALFDMADHRPLHRAAARLLRPGGCLVYSITHPCFNSSHVIKVGEEEDRLEGVITRYALKISGYMTPSTLPGHAMRGQAYPQPYFNRTLSDYLSAGFEAGLVLDGLEETAFPPGQHTGSSSLGWGANFSEFPAVLVARFRLP